MKFHTNNDVCSFFLGGQRRFHDFLDPRTPHCCLPTIFVLLLVLQLCLIAPIWCGTRRFVMNEATDAIEPSSDPEEAYWASAADAVTQQKEIPLEVPPKNEAVSGSNGPSDTMGNVVEGPLDYNLLTKLCKFSGCGFTAEEEDDDLEGDLSDLDPDIEDEELIPKPKEVPTKTKARAQQKKKGSSSGKAADDRKEPFMEKPSGNLRFEEVPSLLYTANMNPNVMATSRTDNGPSVPPVPPSGSPSAFSPGSGSGSSLPEPVSRGGVVSGLRDIRALVRPGEPPPIFSSGAAVPAPEGLFASFENAQLLPGADEIGEAPRKTPARITKSLYSDPDEGISTPWDRFPGIYKRASHPSLQEDHIHTLFAPHGGTIHFRRQLEGLIFHIGVFSPRSAPLWVSLGNTWRATGDTTKAIHCFRRALVVKPNDADALTNLGAIMENIGYIDDALVFVTEALRLRPDNSVQYYILANVYHQKGDLKHSASACETALRIHPAFHPCREKLKHLKLFMDGPGSGWFAGPSFFYVWIPPEVLITSLGSCLVASMVIYYLLRRMVLGPNATGGGGGGAGGGGIWGNFRSQSRRFKKK